MKWADLIIAHCWCGAPDTTSAKTARFSLSKKVTTRPYPVATIHCATTATLSVLLPMISISETTRVNLCPSETLKQKKGIGAGDEKANERMHRTPAGTLRTRTGVHSENCNTTTCFPTEDCFLHREIHPKHPRTRACSEGGG